MLAGALEARRWAGMVLAVGPGEGVGLRVAFAPRDVEGDGAGVVDFDEWHDRVVRVGPHCPDGSYARMEFAVRRTGTTGRAAKEQSAAHQAADFVLEWARRHRTLLMRARTTARGRVDLLGDAPWDWRPVWEERDDGAWVAMVAGTEIAAAIAPQAFPTPDLPADAQVGRSVLGPRAENDPPAAARSPAELPRGSSAQPTAELTAAIAWGPDALATAQTGLAASSERLRRARRALAPRADLPDLADAVRDNLMWMILLQPETGKLYAPAGRRWIFPRPRETADDPLVPDDWTIFGWDSFFNAIQLAQASGELAWAALRAGLATQYPNGNVPNWRSRRAGTPDRSHPPLGAFAAIRIWSQHPDPQALADCYGPLRRWSAWWSTDVGGGRARRGGLTKGLFSWGSDTSLCATVVPPWEEGASGHQRAAWESGQDDLPLWEEVEWDDDRNVLAMSAVDLCSYRAIDLESLARIARLVGDEAAARDLDAQYAHLAMLMNRKLWCTNAGMYLDELPGGHSTRVAASNFLPLAAGVASRRQASRMVEVMLDRDRFWGEWALPTISRDDDAFDDQQYWRGAIWPPMNYLVLQGLRRYGFDDAARALASKGARMFLEERARSGGCPENYDCRTGRGHGRRFQSWGPLLALGMLEAR